jgi:hypothetical protein
MKLTRPAALSSLSLPLRPRVSLSPLSSQRWLRTTRTPTSLKATVTVTPTHKKLFSHISRHNQEAHKPVPKLFDLTGRNYVITGGGQGIGFAMTRAICEMGGNVAVLDLRETPVDAFKTLAGEHGVKAEYFQTDVTREDSLTASFEKVVSSFGRVDGLIPAAGIVIDKPFVEWKWDEVERVQKVNVGAGLFIESFPMFDCFDC